MDLTQLEKDILEWFASKSDSAALKEQCASASVLSREHTGVGLFVQLSCPASCKLADFGCAPNAPQISSSQLPLGASVDLWLESGRLSHLEFVSFGESQFPQASFPYKLVSEL